MGALALILRNRGDLLADICRGRRLAAHGAGLILVIYGCGALYGAVLGMWRSPLLAAYVAVKLPLVLLATALVTALLNWIVGALSGLPLRFGQSTILSLAALAIAATVLASLAPVAWLFTISLPGPSSDARTVHNLLYLTHTLLVAAAGLTGTAFLRSLLSEVAPQPAVARRVYMAWVLAFALVGGEVAWILRPFVGSIYYPVRFLRPDALDGNVYEFIITDVVPWLLQR